MSYRPIKAQKTNTVLQNSAALQRLVARAQSIDHLQQLLNQFLQPALREHCHLATYQAGILTLDCQQWTLGDPFTLPRKTFTAATTKRP